MDDEFDFGRRAAAAAAALNDRIERCHEEVACPKCHAPVGERCRRALRQFTRHGTYAKGQPVLKHPHAERVRAAGIAVR